MALESDIANLIFAFDILAIIGIVFVERRDPANAIPWVLILLLLPFVGFFLYLLFGQNYFKAKNFQIKAENDRQLLEKIIKEQRTGIDEARTSLNDPGLLPYFDMARLLLVSNQAVLTDGNTVEAYTRGEDKFNALFAAIAEAKDHVHMEYYIIRDDELGNKLITALTEKAKEGVEVRLLFDALGNKVPRKKYRELEKYGGKVAPFYKELIPGLTVRINYHDHRKIVVIDGQIGFLGGFNVGDEYLGKGPLGWWRDTAIQVRGPAVKTLQLRFALDWHFATKERVPLNDRFFPDISKHGRSIVQVVSGGPDAKWSPIKEEYLELINAARNTLYIQTPYFIPDMSVFDALKNAALSGVDVRIMFPCRPDHPFVYWASYSYLGDLLKAGVKAYTYENGFIHAKTATVDDVASSIGTANWDIRSFRLNFETNAVIYDHDFALDQRRVFEEDLKMSTEVTPEIYSKRSIIVKGKESVSRLMSSVL